LPGSLHRTRAGSLPSREPGPLLGARRLRAAFEARGIRPTKVLGQNFVIDPNTIRKVVEVAGVGAADRVLEIGAGGGSLTLGLSAAAGKVTALEVDPNLIPILEEMLAGRGNVEVLLGDALVFDVAGVDANILVANLPYNIAVPVVMRMLEEAPQLDQMVVMTQREVGERLAAGPGSKTYGQVSLLVRYYGTAEVVGRVARRAFWPVPNVDSVLVRIRRGRPPPVSREHLFPLVKAGFAQRRKTLRNALASAGYTDVPAALERAGLAPETRAEELELEAFVSLSQFLIAPASLGD
jgi:16S rRNA (adenine1518-N6/adenine1519-N6)-dimethyltransferase